jgi:hypothetical protein
MQKITVSFVFICSLLILWGCKKDNYPGGAISPYISIFDIRNIYKGEDVKLSRSNMFGSTTISGVVVSDHSGNNLPAGLLVIQDARRNGLRGISIPIGDQAAGYHPGDSVIINVEGAVLTKVDGILEITGIDAAGIQKVSSGNPIPVPIIHASDILANPDSYESTLGVVVKAVFDPLPDSTDVLVGDKVLNDGYGNITLHTEGKAAFANNRVSFLAAYYGIFFNTPVDKTGKPAPQLRMRTANDITVLSSTIEITPAIITGFMSDPKGTDANYEYIQFMATQDIDFSVTPYAVVTTNNAGTSTPTGFPAKGWATGDIRTYKFNLTSGKAAKGTFFYVGGTGKMINSSGSTSMSTSNWIRAFNYSTSNGDGFGTKTTNLLANSGNAFGMAIFKDTLVTVNSKPIDVIFIGGSGSLYTPGPPSQGYRIANTDIYDVKHPLSAADQPYYRSGTNTGSFTYNTSDLGYFNMLGGVYNPKIGRWMKNRSQNSFIIDKTAPITAIEGEGATTLQE